MKPIVKFGAFLLFTGVLVHISCKKEYSCEDCAEKNKPPIALAGLDQVITLPTDSASLDGTASSDPDGMISSYLWTKISGPAFFTISNSSIATTFVKNLVAGIYQFELKVKDNGSLFSKDTMQVIVDAVATNNHSPVANAGADQIIVLPTNSINLDGSVSSDLDNNIASYLWTKISGPASFNIANPIAAQTQVANLVEGIYKFELKATDVGGLFSKDTMVVHVKEVLTELEIIYNGGWGCNDICGDGDVYWDSSPWNDSLYSNPNTPLEVSIRLDTSTTWIAVSEIDSPLPRINQFSWQIERGFLWVFAHEGRLIGTRVTVKVKFI